MNDHGFSQGSEVFNRIPGMFHKFQKCILKYKPGHCVKLNSCFCYIDVIVLVI